MPISAAASPYSAIDIPADRFVLAGPGKTPGAGEEPRIYHGDSMHVTIAYCVR